MQTQHQEKKQEPAKRAVAPGYGRSKTPLTAHGAQTPHPTSFPGCVTIFKENTVLVSITTAGGNSDVQSKDELAVL